MSNALAADHDASPDALQTALAPPDAPFVPTHQQLRYLDVYLNADGSESRQELAKRAHVHRVTVQQWFHNLRFTDWFVSTLHRLILPEYQLALRTTLRLAKLGSHEHMKLLMIKMGDIKHGNQIGFDDHRGINAQQTVVLINVPPARQLSPAEVVDITPTHRTEQ